MSFDISKIRQLSNNPSNQEIVDFARGVLSALQSLYATTSGLNSTQRDIAAINQSIVALQEQAPATPEETPSTPTGLVATPGVSYIELTWDIPPFIGYAYTEILRATTNDFTAAAKIGTASPNVFVDVLPFDSPMAYYFYWVRHISQSGVIGPTAATSEIANPYIMAAPTEISLHSGSEHLLLTESGTVINRLYVSWAASLSTQTDFYEIETYDIFNAFIASYTATTTNTYISPVNVGVYFRVRVRARSNVGAKSAWLVGVHTILGKAELPQKPDSFLVSTQGDGTRVFSWALNNPPIDVRVGGGFRIRYKSGTNATWADMFNLHTGLLVSSPFEVNQLAAGEYTFAIKTVDSSDNESADAVYIIATIGSPRLAGALADIYPGELGWPGTLTNCYIDTSGSLVASDQKTWSSFDTDGISWDNWTAYNRNPYLSISYEHPVVDLGSLANVATLVSFIGNGSAVSEVSTSEDGIIYSVWSPANVLVKAQYIKARTTVTVASGIASIASINVKLTANIVGEDLEDLDTSLLTPVAGGGIRLPLVATFLLIKKVDISLQNVGSGCTWELIDKSVSGPHIKMWDSAGTLMYPVIDATVKGL